MAALAALAFPVFCGCGSVTARVKGAGDPYCGFTYDMEKLASGEEWGDWSVQGSAGNAVFPAPRALLWIVDSPLSFAADTILFPVDLLRPDSGSAKEFSERGQPTGSNLHRPPALDREESN